MEMLAKLYKPLLPVTGNSINGPWSKQEIIVETADEYSNKVCMTIWNGKVDINELEVDKLYIFHFYCKSKEYNGKWYTELSLWKVQEPKNKEIQNKPSTLDPNKFLGIKTEEEMADFIGEDEVNDSNHKSPTRFKINPEKLKGLILERKIIKEGDIRENPNELITSK